MVRTKEIEQPIDDGPGKPVHILRGQPWLVNALAYETTWEMKAGRDRPQPITAGMIQEAKENLIQRRVTHLDQLADKLREPRVRRVVEALLTGDPEPARYIRRDGQLDMPKLMEAFQQFFRENSEAWLEGFNYREAGPQ